MKLATPSATSTTYSQLQWISLCLGLALAAQVTTLPLWLLVVVCVAVAIRLGLAARGYAAPSRAIRLVISAVSIAMLLVQFHTFNGLPAGSALLSLMAGLKLLETQSRRDVYVVALIIYFLSLASLLESTSFWLLIYLLAVSWLTTATLLKLTHSAPPPGWGPSARYAGRLFAHAVPLALVLWLFFPRFQGPLWQMPAQGRHTAESGLSDSMSPGDITELALSDEIAFRVRFTATTPPPHERYWRGPVLHDFDGHTWRREAVGSFAPAALTPAGGAYRYVVSLEPHQHNWIFALDWPERWDLADARLTSDYMLVQPRAITRPIEVSATSYTQVQASQPLGATMRRRDTLLPPGRNVRTLELSHRLRDEHPDDMGYVRAVLDLFRQQPFYYTLKPPALADDSVDEFLFITRHGFCGHYASAFATLMRAAGIPARVVTGYYGGAFNRFADYWIVRQSNAHAWDEIWIEGRGWLRIDPTTAIAPERVERDLKDAVQSGEPVRWSEGIPWITDMRLRVDALRQLWRERILFYDQSSQNDLLALLHIPEPDGQKVAMVLAFGLVLALAWLTWQVRREQRRESKDPLARAYDRLCSKLAAVGLPRKAYEGAESFGARIARERPDLAREVSALCRRYSRLRYGESLHHRSKRASVAEMAFAARVRTFRPRRAAL